MRVVSAAVGGAASAAGAAGTAAAAAVVHVDLGKKIFEIDNV